MATSVSASTSAGAEWLEISISTRTTTRTQPAFTAKSLSLLLSPLCSTTIMKLMTMNAIITTTTTSELAHYRLKDPFDGL